MTVVVVNIKNENCDVYVGRRSKFGNSYTHLPIGKTKSGIQVSSRCEAIEKYREYFYNLIETDKEFLDDVLRLKDKKLGCFCAPKECHADIIKEFLDKL